VQVTVGVNSKHSDPRNGDLTETCDYSVLGVKAAATEGVVTSFGV
jgi:hypothetical protein